MEAATPGVPKRDSSGWHEDCRTHCPQWFMETATSARLIRLIYGLPQNARHFPLRLSNGCSGWS